MAQTILGSKANDIVLKKSGFVLDDGEILELAIEAELWAGSSNPIDRFLGACARLWSLLFGTKKEGFIIITNKRVVEISKQKACWVFNTGKEVKTLMPSGIFEVGYTAQGTFCGCFCQAYHLYYEGHTQTTSILLKGANEQDAATMASTLYEILIKPSKSKKQEADA